MINSMKKNIWKKKGLWMLFKSVLLNFSCIILVMNLIYNDSCVGTEFLDVNFTWGNDNKDCWFTTLFRGSYFRFLLCCRLHCIARNIGDELHSTCLIEPILFLNWLIKRLKARERVARTSGQKCELDTLGGGVDLTFYSKW